MRPSSTIRFRNTFVTPHRSLLLTSQCGFVGCDKMCHLVGMLVTGEAVPLRQGGACRGHLCIVLSVLL